MKSFGKNSKYLYHSVSNLEFQGAEFSYELVGDDVYNYHILSVWDGVVDSSSKKVYELLPVFTIDEDANGTLKGAGTKDNPYTWEAK